MRFPRDRATPDTKKRYRERTQHAEVTNPRLGHVHEEEVEHKGEQVELEPSQTLWERIAFWFYSRMGIDK